MNRLVAAVVGAIVVIASACGGASPTPAAVGIPAGAALEIRLMATNIEFVPPALGAPAGVPLHLVLDNQDDGVPHNVALMGANGSTKLGATEVVAGPAETSLDVPGLVPGVYQLLCEVHPTMVTTLTVGS